MSVSAALVATDSIILNRMQYPRLSHSADMVYSTALTVCLITASRNAISTMHQSLCEPEEMTSRERDILSNSAAVGERRKRDAHRLQQN